MYDIDGVQWVCGFERSLVGDFPGQMLSPMKQASRVLNHQKNSDRLRDFGGYMGRGSTGHGAVGVTRNRSFEHNA
ncbi:hypothetical protein WG66_009153 [Moniliophthora roreri]|nr:hypothetical protein WG66_009153 [Moniliophthora roreri]